MSNLPNEAVISQVAWLSYLNYGQVAASLSTLLAERDAALAEVARLQNYLKDIVGYNAGPYGEGVYSCMALAQRALDGEAYE